MMFVDTLDGISTLNLTTMSYQFNMVAVFRDPVTGEFWWAADSGCSCPQPFDSINGFGDMNPLNDLTWRPFTDNVLRREILNGVTGAERLSWLRTLSTTISKLRSEPFVPAIPNPFQQEEL